MIDNLQAESRPDAMDRRSPRTRLVARMRASFHSLILVAGLGAFLTAGADLAAQETSAEGVDVSVKCAEILTVAPKILFCLEATRSDEAPMTSEVSVTVKYTITYTFGDPDDPKEGHISGTFPLRIARMHDVAKDFKLLEVKNANILEIADVSLDDCRSVIRPKPKPVKEDPDEDTEEEVQAVPPKKS